MREGLVVASVGLKARIDSMSPVSETTVLIVRNCSSLLGMALLPVRGAAERQCRLFACAFQAQARMVPLLSRDALSFPRGNIPELGSDETRRDPPAAKKAVKAAFVKLPALCRSGRDD